MIAFRVEWRSPDSRDRSSRRAARTRAGLRSRSVFQPAPSRLPPYSDIDSMPHSVSSRAWSKNRVVSTVRRKSIWRAGVSAANDAASRMARAGRPAGIPEPGFEARAPMREDGTQDVVDEEGDSRLARAGRVVARNDLRGERLDIGGIRCAQQLVRRRVTGDSAAVCASCAARASSDQGMPASPSDSGDSLQRGASGGVSLHSWPRHSIPRPIADP